MNTILFSFLFFLPAGVANMVPVLVAKIPLLRGYTYPLDLGLRFRGKRILGDHKTMRGVVCGIIAGTCVGVLLKDGLFLSFLLSFGALFGDSVKSFFKRQLAITSGKSWFPFDQSDYILGGMLLSMLVVRLSASNYLIIFLEYFLLHLVISYIGYLVHLKKTAI